MGDGRVVGLSKRPALGGVHSLICSPSCVFLKGASFATVALVSDKSLYSSQKTIKMAIIRSNDNRNTKISLHMYIQQVVLLCLPPTDKFETLCHTVLALSPSCLLI